MKATPALVLALLILGCDVKAAFHSDEAASRESLDTQLSAFNAVEGTRFLWSAQRLKRGRAYYESGLAYRGMAVNHLFYNLDDRATRWLFPTSDQRIFSAQRLERETSSGDTERGAVQPMRRVEGFLYHVARQDSNGDGDLDGDDRGEIGVSDAGGQGYTVLAAWAERIVGTFWVDEVRVLVLYEATGRIEGVEFDVRTRKVQQRTRLGSGVADAPAV